MTTVRFAFDLVSPYAYLAWHALRPIAARHGVAVEPVPILFAALLHHHGHKGPAEIPPKRLYVFKDCLRNAHQLGLPLRPPPAHPFNPLLALRVAGLDMDPATRIALVTALFDATWGGGPGVMDPAVVRSIAEATGVPDALVRAAQPEAKQRLRQATEHAIADGAFGVPSMFVDGELFWGLDSLPHLERFLAGHEPDLSPALARWADLPVGATR